MAEPKRQASFRGVPFFYLDGEKPVGRDVVVHQYPKRDEIYAEDMGQHQGSHSLTAVLLGDNYLADGQALEDALNQFGPGELIHPLLGKMTVQIQDCPRTDSTHEGGQVRFKIRYVVTLPVEQHYPAQATQTQPTVKAAVAQAKQATAEYFQQQMDLQRAAQWVSDRIQADWHTLIDRIAEPNQVIGDALGWYQRAQSLGTLLETPAAFVDSLFPWLSDAVRLFASNDANSTDATLASTTVITPDGLADVLHRAATLPPVAAPAASSHNRERLFQNQQALQTLVQQAMIIEVASASAELDYRVRDDALTLQKALTDALEMLEPGADDILYPALKNLRVAVVRDLTDRGAQLPRLVTVTPHAVLPALVHSYQVYGDALRDAELIERNGIVHPGFVTTPELEVLQ